MKMKRFFDLIISIPAYFFLAPLIYWIAFLIWLVMGKGVFFKQIRPGFQGRPFTIYKFRTMREVFDKNGNHLPDAERMTRLGKFLRSASLDELPEILNVIKGDMSIVGPRPLLMQYLDRYTPEQFRRHEVKPGITGWAQINGRNAISWEEKFKLDVWYVDNHSVSLDLKIVASTIRKILTREGINQPGAATMEEFNPNTSKKNVYKFSEDMQ
jgi:sugar transferase EpsL